VVLLIALVVPRLLDPLRRWWLQFGMVMQRLVSPIVLLLFYCLGVVPIGLGLRLFRAVLLEYTAGVALTRRARRSNPRRGYPVVDPRSLVTLGLALLLASFAGCGTDSNPTSNPTPVDSGTVNLVAPVGCFPLPCVGTTIDNIVIRGPKPFAPFPITFTTTSRLPFMPPGSYQLSDASFINSAGITTGCPGVGFTVATALTTTVTFSITRNVCSVTVSGPA
jgi:hypothetical protein